MKEEPEQHFSLQHYISRFGHCSRRKAAALVAAGRVELEGETCLKPWQPVAPGQRVTTDGVAINASKKKLLYLALHKPPGYLSTNVDPQGRPCAINLLQPLYKERLFHVGRLDKNSSGLIFFTNDGDFAQAVQHPSAALEKQYEAKTRTSIPEFMLKHWQRGIDIAGVRYQLRRYQLLGSRKVNLFLSEGLNREIRRVFEHFCIPLKRVHRLGIGTVQLRGLAPGQFRRLKPFELKSLLAGKNPLQTRAATPTPTGPPVFMGKSSRFQQARDPGQNKKLAGKFSRSLYSAAPPPHRRHLDHKNSRSTTPSRRS